MQRLFFLILTLLFLSAVFVLTVDSTELVNLKPFSGYQRGPVAFSGELDELYYLRRYTDEAEYYLSNGSQDDTLCVVFCSPGPCSIYTADQQWYSGGEIEVFIWDYNEAADSLFPHGRAPDRGSSRIGPLGEIIAGPIEITVEGTYEFEELFTADDMPGGGIEWGDSLFVVGFVKLTDDGLPQPLADDVTDRRFTYTWFSGPWFGDLPWGAYSTLTIIKMMTRVGVSLQSMPPDVSMSKLPNTINTEKNCSVRVEFLFATCWWPDNLDLKVVVRHADDEPSDTSIFQMTEEDGNPDYSVTFNLADLTDNGLETGDMIAYWVEMSDDSGRFASNIDQQHVFEIVEIDNPMSPMLLVTQYMGRRIDVITSYLDSNGVDYEWWDTDENSGIDEYTINGGYWNTVFVAGWGAQNIPTRDYSESIYYDAFTSGKNFIYSDMDYFFGNNEVAEPVFGEGDFAYDCFGIESGLNDPEEPDTAFYGEIGDVISGNWVGEPYAIDTAFSGNWTDYISPNESATAFFSDLNRNEFAAVRTQDGDQKTVYFSFDIFSSCRVDSFRPNPDDYPDYWREYLAPTEDFNMLMNNLLDWIDPQVDGIEGNNATLPHNFTLCQNYPNPFNNSTYIQFILPCAGRLKLTVFNVNGREVATLLNSDLEPGVHTVEFNAADYGSGIYLYRLESNSFSVTKKMVLLK